MRDGGLDTLCHETKEHAHSYERWFGSDGSTGGSLTSMLPYTATCASSQYGDWLAVLDADDTPARTGSLYYDPHRIFVTAVSMNTTLYRMQMGYGATGAAAISAETYTELIFLPASTALEETPVWVNMARAPAGTLLWMRIWVDGQDAKTMSFFVGIHEYDE